MCEEPVYQMPDEQLLLAPHQRAGKQRAARWRGLCFDRKHAAWRVRIFYNGKQRHVGRFKDDVAAARAYDKAAYYLYGHKAILNFGFEDVESDPTPVAACIRQAREQCESGVGSGSEHASSPRSQEGTSRGCPSITGSPCSMATVLTHALHDSSCGSGSSSSSHLHNALHNPPSCLSHNVLSLQRQQQLLLAAGLNTLHAATAAPACAASGLGGHSLSSSSSIMPGLPGWQQAHQQHSSATSNSGGRVQVLCAPPLPCIIAVPAHTQQQQAAVLPLSPQPQVGYMLLPQQQHQQQASVLQLAGPAGAVPVPVAHMTHAVLSAAPALASHSCQMPLQHMPAAAQLATNTAPPYYQQQQQGQLTQQQVSAALAAVWDPSMLSQMLNSCSL